MASSIAAMGLMAPAFDNPICDIVVEAVLKHRWSNDCKHVTTARSFERSEERGHRVTVSAIQGAGGVSGVVASSTSGPSAAPLPEGLAGVDLGAFFDGTDDFNAGENESRTLRAKLQKQIDAAIASKSTGQRELFFPDKERVARNRAIQKLKDELQVVLRGSDEEVRRLARDYRVSSTEGSERRAAVGLEVLPEYFTLNYQSLTEFSDSVCSFALQKYGVQLSRRMVRAILETLNVKVMKHAFAREPGRVTRSVVAGTLAVVSTPTDTGEVTRAVKILEDCIANRKVMGIRREVFDGLNAVSHADRLRECLKTCGRADIERKYLLMTEVWQNPQFSEAVVVQPYCGVTISARAGALDAGERLLLGLDDPVHEQDADIVQYAAPPDVMAIMQFYKTLPPIRDLSPSELRTFYERCSPINAKRIALTSSRAQAHKLFSYPGDFVCSKMRSIQARLDTMQQSKTGGAFGDDTQFVCEQSGAVVVAKTRAPDGSLELRFINQEGTFAAPLQLEATQTGLQKFDPRLDASLVRSSVARGDYAITTSQAGDLNERGVLDGQAHIKRARYLQDGDVQSSLRKNDVKAVDYGGVLAYMQQVAKERSSAPSWRDLDCAEFALNDFVSCPPETTSVGSSADKGATVVVSCSSLFVDKNVSVVPPDLSSADASKEDVCSAITRAEAAGVAVVSAEDFLQRAVDEAMRNNAPVSKDAGQRIACVAEWDMAELATELRAPVYDPRFDTHVHAPFDSNVWGRICVAQGMGVCLVGQGDFLAPHLCARPVTTVQFSEAGKAEVRIAGRATAVAVMQVAVTQAAIMRSGAGTLSPFDPASILALARCEWPELANPQVLEVSSDEEDPSNNSSGSSVHYKRRAGEAFVDDAAAATAPVPGSFKRQRRGASPSAEGLWGAF